MCRTMGHGFTGRQLTFVLHIRNINDTVPVMMLARPWLPPGRRAHSSCVSIYFITSIDPAYDSAQVVIIVSKHRRLWLSIMSIPIQMSASITRIRLSESNTSMTTDTRSVPTPGAIQI
jgi:hypothetical protein